MTERWFSVREAAERTGFKEDAIRRAIARGELEGFKVCGRLRIAVDELERFMRAQPAAPLKAPARRPSSALSGKPGRRGRSGEPSFRDMARRAAAS